MRFWIFNLGGHPFWRYVYICVECVKEDGWASSGLIWWAGEVTHSLPIPWWYLSWTRLPWLTRMFLRNLYHFGDGCYYFFSIQWKFACLARTRTFSILFLRELGKQNGNTRRKIKDKKTKINRFHIVQCSVNEIFIVPLRMILCWEKNI